MKRLLRIAAVAIAVASIAIWAALGANTGWTKNRVQEKQTDEITGIEHSEWVDRWLPGVDFLAAGLACSAGLLIGSCIVRPRKAASPSP